MVFLCSLLYSFAFILLLNSLICPCSVLVHGAEETSHHVVSVASLLPSDVCTPYRDSDPLKLELVHRHGPCSPLKSKRRLSHIQILDRDQVRVNWLHHKSISAATLPTSTPSTNSHSRPSPSLAATKIPARAGASLNTGNYVVTVAFGTPKVSQTVIIDTGSDVTWIQCQPCVVQCYPQQDTLFDPTQSSTYVNISCTSSFCSALDTSSCSGSTCIYVVQYNDNSQTVGFFAQDTLTLSPSDIIPNFHFGCGEQNSGLFGRAAGLMGLGREPVSLISQTAQKYGGVFSYCLPPSSSSTGYLTFGATSSNAQFTPMLSQSGKPTFYFLELQDFLVSGKKLGISPTLFSNAGTIIDSGTVITRLPPTAYSALKAAFKKGMSQYPTAPAASILDTCYDLRMYTTVKIPTVAMQYKGTTVNLDPTGILYMASASQFCLAFAPNSADTDIVIVGNTQQRRFNVVYDLSKKLIGFGAGGC